MLYERRKDMSLPTNPHAWLMLFNVGVLLPVSAGIASLPWNRVSRAAAHATLQTCFACLTYVGVGLARQNGSWHGSLGYFLAFGGIPLSVLSRSPVLSPVWHVWIGRCIVVLFLLQSAYGTYLMYDLRFQTISYAVLTFGTAYYAYCLVTARTQAFHITRRQDGTYNGLDSDLDVEGAGWSWHLSRDETRRTRKVSTRKLTGFLVPSGTKSEWWGSGSTVRQVQACLAKRGLTLAGVPSLSAATLGGWIFTGSHGSGGTLWTPAFGRVKVYDRVERTVRIVERKQALFNDESSVDEQRKYVILEVELRPVRNVECTRIAFDVESLRDAEKAVVTETHLRMIFVDKHSALALLWVPADEEERGERACTLIPPWTATLLPASCSRKLGRSMWTGRQTLRQANDFAPDPPFLSVPFMWLYVNFEVFVHVQAVTPRMVWDACRRMKALFSSGSASGRCELRFGKRKMFFDFALTSREYAPVFEAIRDVVGESNAVHLHKGKAQVPTFPL